MFNFLLFCCTYKYIFPKFDSILTSSNLFSRTFQLVLIIFLNFKNYRMQKFLQFVMHANPSSYFRGRTAVICCLGSKRSISRYCEILLYWYLYLLEQSTPQKLYFCFFNVHSCLCRHLTNEISIFSSARYTASFTWLSLRNDKKLIIQKK